MKKLIVIFILLFNFVFSQEIKKNEITFQLAWLHQFQFAGYYIAKEKGFYKDAGLNVKISEFNHNKNLVDLVLNKKADFAIGRSSLLIDKAQGKDVVALAAIFQDSPLMLLTTNPDIQSIDDFKDKKIMITPDAENTASLKAMIKSNNIVDSDLNYIPHSFNIEDLISGKTDLMSSYVSNEPIKLEQRRIPYKIFHPKAYGFNFYSDILFTSKEYLKNNPKKVKNFYEASLKGWEYAFKHKAETAEIIYNKYNSQNKSFIQLYREAEVLEKLFYGEDDEIGCLDLDRLSNIVSTFKTLGLIKEDPNLKDFVYNENHHKKIRIDLSQEMIYNLIVLLIFTAILFSVIVFLVNKITVERNLLNIVLNSSEDLIFYKDRELNYLGCNEAFEKFANLKAKDIIGKSDFEIFDEEFARKARDNDLKVLALGTTNISSYHIDYKGKELYFQAKKVPLNDKKSRIGILGITRDITNLKNANDKLKELALRDELTKTLNRKAYNEKIQEQFNLFKRYNKTFCIAMLDIDNFKRINDTYGHDVGDVILISLCKLIHKNIRKTDSLYRMGGEEFLIMYPETNLENAKHSLELLLNKIRSEIMQQENNIKIKVSVGLCEVKEDDSKNSIYKRVDDNLYYSKHHGKDRITSDGDK